MTRDPAPPRSASSSRVLDGAFLPTSVAANDLLPRLWPEESLSSWIDRMARAMRVAPHLLLLALKDTHLYDVFEQCTEDLDFEAQGRRERELGEVVRAYWKRPDHRMPRLYCARCAYLRFLHGRPYIRESVWSVPWASFCREDAWPLLEEPAGSMQELLRLHSWPQHDREILAARTIWRVHTKPATHLQWAPLWKRVAALERRWHQGEGLPLLRAVGDIAAMLCANFRANRDYSILATLCILPRDGYGTALTEPAYNNPPPITAQENVHARRAAMSAAYCMVEEALVQHGFPPIGAEPDAAVATGRAFWLKLVHQIRGRPWEWLLAVAQRWPSACRVAVTATFETIGAGDQPLFE